MNTVELYTPKTSLFIKSYAMNNGDKLYLPLYAEDNSVFILVPDGHKLVHLHCFSESMFNEQRIRKIYEYGHDTYEKAMEMLDRYKKFGDIEIMETKFEYTEIIYEGSAAI